MDVTVPVFRHADVLLSLVYDLLERATVEEAKHAMALLRGHYDERVKIHLMDDADSPRLQWQPLQQGPS